MKLPFGKKKKTEDVLTDSSVVIEDSGKRIIPETSSGEMTLEDSGVLKIGKKKYAVDLYRVKEPEISVKEEAKTVPTLGRADKWTLYTKVPPQHVAFGSPGLGHKKGQFPLAESIRRDLLGDNWIVIALVEKNKWWVGRKTEGIIEEDSIYEELRQVQEMLMGYKARKDFPIVVPEGWDLRGGTQAKLQDLLGEKVSPLRKFGFIANNLVRIILALLVIGVAYTSWSIKTGAERKRIAEEKRLAELRKNRVVVNDKDYPWFDVVRLNEFIRGCGGAIENNVMAIPGWNPQPSVCQYADRKVVLTQGYLRGENGRISWLRDAYVDKSGNLLLDASGNIATYSLPHDQGPQDPDKAYFKNKPWTPENIQRVLRERFQNLGLPVQITTTASKTPPGQKVEKAVFNNSVLSISSTTIPVDVAEIMRDVPATVPDNLVWDMNSNTWTLTFKVYHPAILPDGAI